jgi:hypothetical protein
MSGQLQPLAALPLVQVPQYCLDKSPYHSFGGSRRLPTAVAQIEHGSSHVGICGGQSDNG